MAWDIELREVRGEDLTVFFKHQLDPESNRMSAFTPEDPTDRSALARFVAIGYPISPRPMKPTSVFPVSCFKV